MGGTAFCGVWSVLVVDDHQLVRRGLAGLLAEIPCVQLVAEAGSGEEAIRLARQHAPEIVLMDLRMPGIGGLEAARRIRIALPRTRIVGVTAWEDEPLSRLCRHGFSACVGKSVGPAELEAVMRRVMLGAGPGVAEPAPRPDSDNPFDALTGRELQVCLLQFAGLRAHEIAERLFITVKTVHTFRYRIFEKLGVRGDIELARLATRHGMIGVDP